MLARRPALRGSPRCLALALQTLTYARRFVLSPAAPAPRGSHLTPRPARKASPRSGCAALFEAAQILLAEAGALGELLLRQARRLAEARGVAVDQLAHIHAGQFALPAAAGAENPNNRSAFPQRIRARSSAVRSSSSSARTVCASESWG